MTDVEKQKSFLINYEQYILDVLKPTNYELRKVFEKWRDHNYWSLVPRLSRLPSPSPVQRAISRIKRPESVVDKILRNTHEFTEGLCINSVKKMHDAVAGRILVYFLANLPMIDKELRNSDDIEISSASPPIAYLSQEILETFGLNHVLRKQKDSGYASIHYIVRLRESVVPKIDRPWFEIQVRTITEDVWGEIEHVLGYKPGKKTSFAVKKQFKIISSELTSIDEHFNLLYEELSRYQEESIYKEDNPLNAENLPAVLSEGGIGCAQKEIDGLLKILFSHSIRTVGDLRTISTKHNIDLIHSTYKDLEDRNPTNFETIASISAISGVDSDSSKIEAIKAQIQVLKAWEEMKKNLT